jgi:radical SAM superfamily enzyme YgiQ (UPF0313 family)
MTTQLPETSFAEWYSEAYPRLSGAGLWLRGDEPGRIDVAQYHSRPFRVMIARLSTYADTAESLTHALLYQIARGVDGVFPDMAFLPPPKDGRAMSDAGVPWLLGTATKRGPRGFDLIALSNAIVQELLNVPVMLRKSSIPLDKSERLADPTIPLVILGGANARASSVLWCENSPVDGIFVGESSASIARILTICRDAKAAGVAKTEVLECLREVPGFFVPSVAPGVRPAPEPNPNAANRLMAGAPAMYVEESLGRGWLQISEGCGCFCGFCSESFWRKPYRETSVRHALAAARALKQEGGLDRVELFSFNFNMHGALYQLIDWLTDTFATIGPKSQRFDLIAHDRNLLPTLHALGKSSITCGLEGISPRLRRYLHKSLDEKELRDSLTAILAAPIRELKVFLIATGLEQEDDFEALGQLTAFCAGEIRRLERTPRVIFSLTPLVRFPWTPLEFENGASEQTLTPIIHAIGHIVRAQGFEFRHAMDVQEYWLSQVLVRARDPGILPALVDAIDETDFVYYRGADEAFLQRFRARLAERGVELPSLLSAPKPDDEVPWRAMETGVSRSFLVKAWQRATAFVDEGYCLTSPGKPGECAACGACTSKKQRTAMTDCGAEPEPNVKRLREKLTRQRQSEEVVHILVRTPPALRGVPVKARALVVARAVMTACPDLVTAYAGFRGSMLDKRGFGDWATGDDVLALAFRSGGAAMLLRRLADASSIVLVNQEMGSRGIVSRIVASDARWCIGVTAASPYPVDFGAYATTNHLPHTLRKTGDGAYAVDLTKQAAKKRLVDQFTYRRQSDGTWEVRFVALEKFDMRAFVQTTFRLPSPQEWVRVSVQCELAEA